MTKPRSPKQSGGKGAKSKKVLVESSLASNVRSREPKLKILRGRGPIKRQPQPGTSKNKASMAKFSADEIIAARKKGMLPHEWLLAVMRGEHVSHHAYNADTGEIVEIVVLPTFQDRIDAAKTVAPYFAPRLSNHVVKTPPSAPPYEELSDAELDKAIKDKQAELRDMPK